MALELSFVVSVESRSQTLVCNQVTTLSRKKTQIVYVLVYSLQRDFMHYLLSLCPAWVLSFAGGNTTALWLVPCCGLPAPSPGTGGQASARLPLCFSSPVHQGSEH